MEENKPGKMGGNRPKGRTLKKLGWSPIPLCHLIEKKVRRGRPKQLVDSDEETTTRPRGRPRKIKAPDLTNEELVAQYLGQAY